MQTLTAPPRSSFTETQIHSLLTSDSITINVGCEILDFRNKVLEDISDDLVGGSISHDNFADIHGSCKLEFTREFGWGRDRVRPYMTLDDGVITARFNLGVYVLTSPAVPRGEDPVTYMVDGYDLLYLLDSTGPGDSRTVDEYTSYITAIADVFYDVFHAAVGDETVLYRIEGTKASLVPTLPMVWALVANSPVSWLDIVNDLLAAINYTPLWVDQDGMYRSQLDLRASTRAVEWTFDTADNKTNLIHESRTMSAEAFGVPNWWRFVQSNRLTRPTEGSGQYTVTNQSDGATSIDAVGRTIRKILTLDVANQATLVERGNQIVIADTQLNRTYDIQVDPFPLAGYLDIVRFIDGDTDEVCQVRSWTLNLDGSPGKWHLEVAA